MTSGEMSLVKKELIQELRKEFREVAALHYHRTFFKILDKTLDELETRYCREVLLSGDET